MLGPHPSHFTAEETEEPNTLSEAFRVTEEVREHRLGTTLLTTAMLLLFGKEDVYPHHLAESQGSCRVTSYRSLGCQSQYPEQCFLHTVGT